MSVADLFDGQFVRYFRNEADRPGTLWVFQHIPKTAGSSFAMELGQRLSPAANVHADHANLARPARETLEESLAAFIGEQPHKVHRFVSGHLRGAQIRRIRQAYRPTKFVTMLRNPVARVVSDFRYMRTPAHPNHAAVIATYPAFETYIDDPRSQNKMFRFLRRNPKLSVEETIAEIESHFAFVGTQELYDDSCRILFRLLGDDRPPQVHTRKTEDRRENEIPNLEALKAKVAEANAQDMAIYTHFASRLEAIRPKVAEWLSEARPE